MKYAKWAPSAVVDEYQRQVEVVNFQRRTVDEEVEHLSGMSDQEWLKSPQCRLFSMGKPNYSKAAYLRDSKAFIGAAEYKLAYYKRLVSSDAAREIWDTLSRHQAINGLPDKEDGEREYMYAHWCWRAFESARNMPQHTVAEKRDHLNLIAAKAADLKRLFLASPYFNHAHFIKQVASRDCPDFLGALIMSPHSKNDLTPEGKTSRPQQIIRMYESLSLEVILGCLADLAIAESRVAPKVKKVHSANAQRNYFVREIHGYHVYRYGKPLWNLLAASTNVMFDLSVSESLSADDVRPLISDWKKPAK